VPNAIKRFQESKKRAEHLDKTLRAVGACLLYNMAYRGAGRNSAQYLGAVPTSVQLSSGLSKWGCLPYTQVTMISPGAMHIFVQ